MTFNACFLLVSLVFYLDSVIHLNLFPSLGSYLGIFSYFFLSNYRLESSTSTYFGTLLVCMLKYSDSSSERKKKCEQVHKDDALKLYQFPCPDCFSKSFLVSRLVYTNSVPPIVYHQREKQEKEEKK